MDEAEKDWSVYGMGSVATQMVNHIESVRSTIEDARPTITGDAECVGQCKLRRRANADTLGRRRVRRARAALARDQKRLVSTDEKQLFRRGPASAIACFADRRRMKELLVGVNVITSSVMTVVPIVKSLLASMVVPVIAAAARVPPATVKVQAE